MPLLSRRLLAFVAVAEELHFGRAAQRLNMSQPPLSQQIRAFESEIGTALFERTTRLVRLTPAGQMLLTRVRHLMTDGERAITAARRAAAGEVGTLALGFTPTAAYQILPRALAAHRRKFPDVAFIMHELNSVEQVSALRSGRIDVALLRHHPSMGHDGLRFEPIAREPMVLALPAGHRATSRRRVPLKLLQGESLIGFDPNASSYFHGLLRTLFEAAAVQPRIVHQSILPTMLALVEAGMGVALVPASAALRSLTVAYRPLSGGGNLGMASLHSAVRAEPPKPQTLAFLATIRGLRGTLATGPRIHGA